MSNNSTVTKRKLYAQESLDAAIADVNERKCSIRAAAKTYGVPRVTLMDRLSGRVQHGKKTGVVQQLSVEDEQRLVEYNVFMSAQGYGKTKDMVLVMAGMIARRRGKSFVRGVPSKKWWQNFCKRHPEVSVRTAQPFGFKRGYVDSKKLNLFYDNLMKVMTENEFDSNFLENPGLIWNCDETAFEFDSINRKVIAERGQRFVPRVVGGNHEKVSVLACVSASGQYMPPQFIYKSTSGNIPKGAKEGGMVDALYDGQTSAWMTKDLFFKWFQEIFLKYGPTQRPILLIYDGLKCHVTLETLKLAKLNHVILYCLPAHASHLLQPLDLSVFKAVKSNWARVCSSFNHLSAGEIINVFNFARMFKVSWIRSATPDVIINGFKAAGIYPFNRNAIPPSKIKVSGENLEPSVIEHPGLPVEPLSFSSSSRDQIVSQPSFPAVHHAPSAVTISSSPVVPFVSSGIGPSSQVDHAPSVVTASSSPIVPSVPCSSSHIDFIPFSPVQHPSSLSTPSRETSTSADATFSSPLLKELERAVSKETIDKWNRRYVEGYDLKDDHLYNAWKMTKDQITSKRSYTITSKRGAVTIDEDIADILARPSKLKAATATKKRTGGMPDPSNKELTGSFLQEFQEAIDQEIDRKKKIAKAKEERKKKKEKDEKEKAERKKRRKEEILKKAVDKENKQQQKKEKPVSKASSLWTDM